MITRQRLKELFKYDADTGNFIRLETVNYNAVRGDIAGSMNDRGYLVIQIERKPYKAHRLAFLYTVGSIPAEVDHINHVKDDNRWINLRAADRHINNKNASKRKDNSSGTTGVYLDRITCNYTAQIVVNGKYHYLGTYALYVDAVLARHKAEKKYNFHTNHGT